MGKFMLTDYLILLITHPGTNVPRIVQLFSALWLRGDDRKTAGFWKLDYSLQNILEDEFS